MMVIMTHTTGNDIIFIAFLLNFFLSVCHASLF